MKAFLAILLSVVILSCTNQRPTNPKVEIQTEFGSIQFELYPEKAPITCENFLKYIEQNEFKSAIFYRTVNMKNQANNNIKIEVIQGGLGFDVEESAFPPIQHETTNVTGIKHLNGTISMARSEPGTASTEFFICINDQPELDFGGMRNPDGQGFAAFGKVIKGMDIVQKIQNQANENQMLINPVKIDIIKKE
jgi:peptidyl-prolyl cis-trans isomerase A (cyclophilin A)